MITTTITLTDFLLARIAEDEADARTCAEMFPSPWEIADRGWRVRIYASDVPTEDLFSDAEGAMTVRQPVVMEVEPDRRIEDPHWLSERVAHIARHDPARVLAEVASKRAIVQLDSDTEQPAVYEALRILAAVYRNHEDYDPAWAVS